MFLHVSSLHARLIETIPPGWRSYACAWTVFTAEMELPGDAPTSSIVLRGSDRDYAVSCSIFLTEKFSLREKKKTPVRVLVRQLDCEG